MITEAWSLGFVEPCYATRIPIPRSDPKRLQRTRLPTYLLYVSRLPDSQDGLLSTARSRKRHVPELPTDSNVMSRRAVLGDHVVGVVVVQMLRGPPPR